jgi:competence protein ComEC
MHHDQDRDSAPVGSQHQQDTRTLAAGLTAASRLSGRNRTDPVGTPLTTEQAGVKSVRIGAFECEALRMKPRPSTSARVLTHRRVGNIRWGALVACALAVGVACADARAAARAPMPDGEIQRPADVTISRIMVDPSAVSDELGEWIEITNNATSPVDLRGWHLASARDPGFTIPGSLVIRPHSAVILGRSGDAASNGGVRVALVYSGIVLANSGDWVVLANPAGVTIDSVGWKRAPRGTPIVHVAAGIVATRPDAPSQPPTETALPVRPQPQPAAPPELRSASRPPATTELVVRILDVGQGDAVLIQNGGSTVLVDGGPAPAALGDHLDRLGLNGTTIDAVVLTHAHADHYQGLRELFTTRRNITVRYFWENQDPSTNVTLQKLRDSIAARVPLGLVYRDTDDPCANGAPLCTITLRGGAKLHIMRPDPSGAGPNNRSPALKLVGPDSASFTMWMAGDAEADDIQWFTRSYRRNPGMRVDVLKADHHGSCNGVTDLYLDELAPSLLVASLGAVNDYGHMHTQAKAMYARHGIPWYRTDQNGTITLRSAGTPRSRYSITIERGGKNMSGPSDRRSTSAVCR